MATLDVSLEAQDKLLKQATARDLYDSLSAKLHIDPIRNHRYRLQQGSGAIASMDPLSEISSPEPIFNQLKKSIDALNKSEAQWLLESIQSLLRLNPVIGSVFSSNFFEIGTLLGKRLAFFELQEKGTSAISGGTSHAIKASMKL